MLCPPTGTGQETCARMCRCTHTPVTCMGVLGLCEDRPLRALWPFQLGCPWSMQWELENMGGPCRPPRQLPGNAPRAKLKSPHCLQKGLHFPGTQGVGAMGYKGHPAPPQGPAPKFPTYKWLLGLRQPWRLCSEEPCARQPRAVVTKADLSRLPGVKTSSDFAAL